MMQKKHKLSALKAGFASLAILGTVLVAAPSFAADCNGTSTYFQWNCNTSDGNIMSLVKTIFTIVSAGVVLVIIIGIIWGGVQYSMAAGDKNKMGAAVGMIRNCIIALILYIGFYIVMGLLVPGVTIMQLTQEGISYGIS
jgi:heme/copper-type cytochrome/quinol oxidase subunit 2